jgi:hypothetical protein
MAEDADDDDFLAAAFNDDEDGGMVQVDVDAASNHSGELMSHITSHHIPYLGFGILHRACAILARLRFRLRLAVHLRTFSETVTKMLPRRLKR